MLSEKEIENIVINGYRLILKREPDPGGFGSYKRQIKLGLKINDFHELLKIRLNINKFY